MSKPPPFEHPSILTRPDFREAARKNRVLGELLLAAQYLRWPEHAAVVGIAGEAIEPPENSGLLDEGMLQIERTGFRIQGRVASGTIFVQANSLGMGDGPTVQTEMSIGGTSSAEPLEIMRKLARQLLVAEAMRDIQKRLKALWPEGTGLAKTATPDVLEAHRMFVEIGTIARAEALAAEAAVAAKRRRT